jgi:hypothetical protein
MNANRWYALVRLGMALLVLAALGTQFAGSLDDPNKSVVMFWSEFTYQGNLLVAVVLLMGAWFLWSGAAPGRWWDMLRGATVTYTAMIFVVYRFLVEGTSNTPSTGISYYEDWASDMLHKVLPVLILVDWLIVPPMTRLGYRRALQWAIYPLVYCAYSLVRGVVVEWYPYSFLDPEEAGNYGMVALYVVAITIGFVAFSMAVVWLGNAMRHWWEHRAHLPHHDGVGAPA